LPGPHNFFRGGSLTTYHVETHAALAALKDKVDVCAATAVWEAAITTSWGSAPVWIHGDISPGNLLIQDGQLSSVIDFGMLAVGDPACDLAIAWTLFEGESREIFRALLPFDGGTWARARAWTLWKALIIATGLTDTNAIEAARPWQIIEEVLADHRSYG
jgi:aminoglycoside phosphotransferase (APT) family kinase protein